MTHHLEAGGEAAGEVAELEDGHRHGHSEATQQHYEHPTWNTALLQITP